MRTSGSPAELEHRRRLAVERVLDGYSTAEVADFLGVDPSGVRRWVAAFQRQGAAGLAARPVTGRPPKLTSTQEKIIRRWLAESPTEHGFATQLWTAPRLAQIIGSSVLKCEAEGFLGVWPGGLPGLSSRSDPQEVSGDGIRIDPLAPTGQTPWPT